METDRHQAGCCRLIWRTAPAEEDHLFAIPRHNHERLAGSQAHRIMARDPVLMVNLEIWRQILPVQDNPTAAHGALVDLGNTLGSKTKADSAFASPSHHQLENCLL